MACMITYALTVALLAIWVGAGSGFPVTSFFLTGNGSSSASPPLHIHATQRFWSNGTVVCLNEGVELAVNKTTGEIYFLPPTGSTSMASEQMSRLVVQVEAPYQPFSHEQDIVSLIVFGYVSTLCVFAFFGMIGVAILTCCQNSRTSASRRRQDGYQALE